MSPSIPRQLRRAKVLARRLARIMEGASERGQILGAARAIGDAIAGSCDPAQLTRIHRRLRDVSGPSDPGSTAGGTQLAALLAASRAVTSSLDLDTILAAVARQVREVIACDECTVFLLDRAGEWLVPVVADVESHYDEVLACRLRPGEGITGWVARSGRGEIVNDALRDPRAVQVPGTPVEESALLIVPLFDRDQVAGVVVLARTGQRAFVPADLELATLFAGHCSAAITNARAYEGAQRAIEELRETQAQLVQAAKLNALGEMAGGVAHDFNNMLAAILGRTQLMLQTVGDPELRRQLEVVEQAALDGAQAVRRVQEFTRVRQDERFEPLAVDEVIDDVIELTRPVWEAESKRHGITIAVERRRDARRAIGGNAGELREVFTNLVLNAVDAMPEGGTLEVTSADVGPGVEVRVRDTGIGMDAEVVKRVFDPFFTTKGVQGTGLGLSVAWGIVSRHHGTIDVQSVPGDGSTFTLRFPPASGMPARQEPGSGGPLPSLDVLVVEDEEPVRRVLADVLSLLGQRVRTAPGGAAGIAALYERVPDVLFTDLGMPEVNGWDVATAARAKSPGVPVVLVTGWGVQMDAAIVRARGISDVVAKPFTVEDIEHVLRGIAGRRSTRAA